MGLFEQFPYQNFHELNLDWLIQQINMVKESVVLSVNGQTGDVILYPEAFVRLPDLSDTTTWSFFRYVDGKAEGVQFINGQPMQRIDDLNRYNIYDSGNPPPYPVTAVNGQTGDVVIAVPVQSVNGMTGNVILYQNASIEFPAISNQESWEMWRETDTNTTLGVKFTTGQPMKRLDHGQEYTVYDSQNQPPYPVESVAGLTGAVAILNTQIVTDQGQQKVQIVFPVNSVDGQTGSVNTWAYTNNATTKLPLAAPADLWNLTRDINSGTVGLRFTYDSVNGSQAYLTFNDGTNPETALRLLTPADIPSSSGVVSVNGLSGVVDLYADHIQMSNSDNTLVEDAINNNAADITDIQGDITNIERDVTDLQSGVLSNTQAIGNAQTDIRTIYSNLAAYQTLKSGETDVSAGNVRIPLNYSGHKYLFIEVLLNSQSGNPAATRGSIILPLNDNYVAATYQPVQLGSVRVWVRLENSAAGLLIIGFGGTDALFVEAVNGIVIVG